jgi:hypothetical protein
VFDKGCQQVHAFAQRTGFLLQPGAQHGQAGRGIIGQRMALEMGPDLLIWVEFRRIPRKLCRDDSRMTCQVALDRARAIVGLTAIPKHGEGTGIVTVQGP